MEEKMRHHDRAPESSASIGVDPVCGMKVSFGSPHRFVVNGTEAFFCSEHCLEKFSADPDRYLHNREGERPSKARTAGTYTCPMHPAVRADRPGPCPRCGTALERKAATADADDEENHELRDMKRRFGFAAAVTIPLVILAMGDMLPGQPISRLLSARVRTFAELLLATPVCIWAAWPFYVRAVQYMKPTGTINKEMIK